MRRRLGISLYPDHSDADVDKAYVSLASSFGFERIFMSMLEVREGKEAVVAKFKDLIAFCHERGFEIVLDVAPNIFDELGISYDDLSFFHDLGADGIRLDLGFDGRKEAMLTYNEYGMSIELNMSNDVAYVDNILTYEASRPFLCGCHNFYPQRGSALPYDFFESCTRRFKEKGLRTAAFVSSAAACIGPWDVNDGLPTLEMHRDCPIDVAAKHLFATGLIDDVIIGNAYASEDELRSLSSINRYQVCFSINTLGSASAVEQRILFDEQHERRGDISSQVIRSTEVRKKYRNFENAPHDNEGVFQVGDVVIGNDLFGKYKNELQVVLAPHSDARKNRVGKIRDEELLLLPYVRAWSKFRFSR